MYGGATETITAGFAAIFGYSGGRSEAPDGREMWAPRAASVSVCMYPHWLLAPEASGREADHPHGCDVDPVKDPLFAATAAVNTAIPASIEGIYNYAAEGDVYLGYSAYNVSPHGTPYARALGVWIDVGPPAY